MIDTEVIEDLLSRPFSESNLPLPGKQSGKVRDWYPLSNGRRLLVTTDRLSAFDRILASVPYKGQVLNQLAAWWFDQTADIIPNHKINTPDPNALVGVEASPIAVEVIVRGYITGVTSTALWYRYNLGERNIYGTPFLMGCAKTTNCLNRLLPPLPKAAPPVTTNVSQMPKLLKKGWWQLMFGNRFKRRHRLSSNVVKASRPTLG
jgi:phosphoribosylaminoimidazole-succinocarboxamide synthase